MCFGNHSGSINDSLLFCHVPFYYFLFKMNFFKDLLDVRPNCALAWCKKKRIPVFSQSLKGGISLPEVIPFGILLKLPIWSCSKLASEFVERLNLTPKCIFAYSLSYFVIRFCDATTDLCCKTEKCRLYSIEQGNDKSHMKAEYKFLSWPPSTICRS